MAQETTANPAPLLSAEEDSAAAEQHANVNIRLLHSPEEASEASSLLDSIWNVKDGSRLLDPGITVALAHSGNYVAGAYDLETNALVGVTIGFFGQPLGTVMHSHIAGVKHGYAGRGVGAAMKLHQRLWCLRHGISQMKWTFDPLIARNAYFNFQRLGVKAVKYYANFYGSMRDGVNSGQASDRLLVSWQLDQPLPLRKDSSTDFGDNFLLSADVHGNPCKQEFPSHAKILAAQIPQDIERLRGTAPERAGEWRMALRDVLHDALARQWVISDFDKSGAYCLVPQSH